MDRYYRVEKPRNEAPISDNEIRITAMGRMRNYIGYGMSLLEENGHDEITIKAMGRAISKTVMVAELIKRRIAGLHQNTSTESVDITDTWEPLEEGLLPLETTRHISMITLTLSKKALDTSSTGYQPPIPAEEVRPAFDYEHEGSFPTGRGRGRGGRGGGRRGRGRGFFSFSRLLEYITFRLQPIGPLNISTLYDFSIMYCWFTLSCSFIGSTPLHVVLFLMCLFFKNWCSCILSQERFSWLHFGFQLCVPK